MAEYKLGIVGTGNTLAGDDGVGNIVANMLRERYPEIEDVLFFNLETDPLELWDVLPRAESFIFVDAFAGEPPGRLVTAGKNSVARAYAPSLHQMDLATVMDRLCSLREGPDPDWSIWGVTIRIPEELGEGLSAEVFEAVEMIVKKLSRRIEEGDYSTEAPGIFERMFTT